MSTCTVLGMQLDVGEDDPIVTAQPVSAFIVVKALDEDGDLVYLTGATEGLHSVECLGGGRVRGCAAPGRAGAAAPG